MRQYGASASPTACLREAWSRPAASPPKAAPACAECGATVSVRNTSGRCYSCAAKNRGPIKNRQPRVGKCEDCGKGITASARLGRCPPCATRYHNSLPETIEKRKQSWEARLAKPGEREKLAKQIKRNREKAMTDPETYERFAERGRWLVENVLSTPEVQAKLKASRKRAGKKLSDYRLAWCPPELRDLHRQNMKRMKLAESKKIIEREWRELRAARHPYFPDVVDFMRRFTAVVDRLQYGHERKRYRVGLADLTAGELLQRAESKGYICPQFPQKRELLNDSSPETIAA